MLEKLPNAIELEGGPKVQTIDYNPSDTILITSANGHLIPFTIKKGSETFIVLNMYLIGLDSGGTITDWKLRISVWASKYLS